MKHIFRIKHLSQELRDLLVTHLDVPSAISMGSWQMVEDFLTASGTFVSLKKYVEI